MCVTDSDGTANIRIDTTRPHNYPEAEVLYFHSPTCNYFGYSPQMRAWLRAHVKDYDLIHISGIWSFPQRYASTFARRNNIPYFISPRGSCDNRLVRTRLTLFKLLYVYLIDRKNLLGATAIHYTTQAESTHSILRSLCPSSFVVPNASTFLTDESGSDLDHTHQQPEQPYLLYVGRLNWKKQLDKLVQAFSTVSKTYPEYTLILAGPEDNEVGNMLRQLGKSEGIAEKLVFTGPVSGALLVALYRSANLFVLPSLAENFGHSAVEALSLGIPTVLSRNVDIVELREIQDIAILCDPTATSLAAAIQGALDNLQMWTRRTKSGSSAVRRLFDIRSVARRMETNYVRSIRQQQ